MYLSLLPNNRPYGQSQSSFSKAHRESDLYSFSETYTSTSEGLNPSVPTV